MTRRRTQLRLCAVNDIFTGQRVNCKETRNMNEATNKEKPTEIADPVEELVMFEPRVFIDNHGEPKMAKMIEGNVWIFYLHPDNKWVTQQKISPDTAHFLLNNLTKEEQELYPAIL